MGLEFADALRLETKEVLKHESFLRAPMQSKLLSYLAERSAEQGGGQITQYDIAVEALGRNETFDENSDSSVRTQISRLRKNLASYYSLRAPLRDGCIYIKPGQYSLSLGSLLVAYPELSQAKDNKSSWSSSDSGSGEMIGIAEWPSEHQDNKDPLAAANMRPPRTRVAFAGGLLAAVGLGMIVAVAPSNSERADDQSLSALERPRIAYDIRSVKPALAGKPGASLLNLATSEVGQRLSRSMVALEAAPDGVADYNLSITFDEKVRGERFARYELEADDGRIVYQAEDALPEDIFEAREDIGWHVAGLVSPPGIVSQDLIEKVPAKPRSDFECFLQVEVGRSGGIPVNELLEECSASYSGSSYYPFLKARELFLAFQFEMMENGRISDDSDDWSILGQLLRDHPRNPYLNALAAKVLFSDGRCREASRHAEMALDRGRDYPALELLMLVEKGTCKTGISGWDDPAMRVRSIVRNQTKPHALLEAYAVSTLLVFEGPSSLDLVPKRDFSYDHEQPLVELTDQLRKYAIGQDAEQPAFLAALVWSRPARDAILASN